MRIIDCYYIKGTGKDSKCYKIHGVGIAYNVCRSLAFCKVVSVVSAVTPIPPLGVAVAMSLGGGVVKAGADIIQKGGLL